MSQIVLNTETGAVMPILEETPFDVNAPGSDMTSEYTVQITSEGVRVYSECCSALMSRETAIAVRDGINKWLEQTA